MSSVPPPEPPKASGSLPTLPRLESARTTSVPLLMDTPAKVLAESKAQTPGPFLVSEPPPRFIEAAISPP